MMGEKKQLRQVIEATLITGFSFVLVCTMLIMAHGLSFPDLLGRLIKGLYVPGYNYFGVGDIQGIPIFIPLYFFFFITPLLFFIYRFAAGRINKEMQGRLFSSQQFFLLMMCVFSVVVILQSLGHGDTFSKQFRAVRGKTTEEKYRAFFYFKEEYKFAEFVRRSLPDQARCGLRHDWNFNDPGDAGRWISLRYFLYPMDLLMTASDDLGCLLFTYSYRIPNPDVPMGYKIVVYDAKRLITLKDEDTL